MEKIMKKYIYIIILILLCPVLIYSQTADNVVAGNWVKQKFAKGSVPPFSFVYGGKMSDSFIKTWDYKAEKLKSDEKNVENSVFTYSDRQTGLVVKCFVTFFTDYNAAEYMLRFINTSSLNTPIIENTAVINNVFSYNTGGKFILHHSLGSNAAVNDFQPFDETMSVGKNIYISPNHGRSSDEAALPFFNIESPAQQGIIVAVGWSGKWYADVVQKDDNSVSLKSGMENMHLTLYPKEEIRTPKICMLFWNSKDRIDGHNQFRRFILAHHTRRVNGKIPVQPLSSAFELEAIPYPCDVHTCITEESAIAHIKRYELFKFKPDLYWMDAGWYSGCTWENEDGQWGFNVGNWTVDKERFPNGLKPVSDAAHAAGAKFMVWFEPERVWAGTQIYKEHNEWVTPQPNSDNNLFNLGNKDARLWITDYYTDFFKKNGIDYYRQDFNTDPLPFWKRMDTPDRIGIAEAKHIEGLYAFWDSLLVRFPEMIIDNCAGGGRRIDLETVSRSTPFWRTDLEQNPTGNQCHTYGLNLYLPLHGTGMSRAGNYYVRSAYGSTAVINWSLNRSNNETIQSYQKYLDDFKRFREYYLGDYYPLSAPNKYFMGANFWLAYQLNRPEKKDGIILAFRREKCLNETLPVKLCGLNADSNYELVYEDEGIRIIKSGSELMNGLELKISDLPGSLLISYKMINK